MEQPQLKRTAPHRTSCRRRPRAVPSFMLGLSSATQSASAGAISLCESRAQHFSFHICSSQHSSSFFAPVTPYSTPRQYSTACHASPEALERSQGVKQSESPTFQKRGAYPSTPSQAVSQEKEVIGKGAQIRDITSKNSGAKSNGLPLRGSRDVDIHSSPREGSEAHTVRTKSTLRRREYSRVPPHLVDNVLIRGTDQERQAYIDALLRGDQMMSIRECNDVLSALLRLKRTRDALAVVQVWEHKPFSDMLVVAKAVKTFTIMIDVCGKSLQLSRAFALFHGMRRAEVRPNLITYNSMIAACARSNEPNMAYGLFEEMKLEGLHPDKFTYGSLIDSFAKTGQVERAFQISKIMEDERVKKDQTIYSALMDACGRAKQLERAFEVFEEMKRNGVWPNLITFSVLIDTCANARQPEKAFQLFSEIKHWGYPRANVVVYTALIDACSKAGWPARAELVLKSMVENGVQPNEITFGALIDSWTKEGNLNQAFHVLDRMVSDHNVFPNAVLIGGLIDACRRLGAHERAKEIWEVVLKYNIRPSRSYYPALIAMAARNEDLDVACAITGHAYARGSLRRVALNTENLMLRALACAIIFLRNSITNATSCPEDVKEHHLNRLRVVFNSTAIQPAEVSSIASDEAYRFCMAWHQFDPKPYHTPAQRGIDRGRDSGMQRSHQREVLPVGLVSRSHRTGSHESGRSKSNMDQGSDPG